MKQFSRNPTPDEFDSDHIAYEYNSLVVPDESNNPPLMAERGVADGYITASDNPVFPDGANVLLANGRVVWLWAGSKGKLVLGSTGITPEGLANLNLAASKIVVQAPEPDGWAAWKGMGVLWIAAVCVVALVVGVILLMRRFGRTG